MITSISLIFQFIKVCFLGNQIIFQHDKKDICVEQSQYDALLTHAHLWFVYMFINSAVTFNVLPLLNIETLCIPYTCTLYIYKGQIYCLLQVQI